MRLKKFRIVLGFAKQTLAWFSRLSNELQTKQSWVRLPSCKLLIVSNVAYLIKALFFFIVVCFDAKINFDDNAKFRQSKILAMDTGTEADEREVEAGIYGLNYIPLDGNIACMGKSFDISENPHDQHPGVSLGNIIFTIF